MISQKFHGNPFKWDLSRLSTSSRWTNNLIVALPFLSSRNSYKKRQAIYKVITLRKSLLWSWKLLHLQTSLNGVMFLVFLPHPKYITRTLLNCRHYPITITMEMQLQHNNNRFVAVTTSTQQVRNVTVRLRCNRLER